MAKMTQFFQADVQEFLGTAGGSAFQPQMTSLAGLTGDRVGNQVDKESR